MHKIVLKPSHTCGCYLLLQQEIIWQSVRVGTELPLKANISQFQSSGNHQHTGNTEVKHVRPWQELYFTVTEPLKGDAFDLSAANCYFNDPKIHIASQHFLRATTFFFY